MGVPKDSSLRNSEQIPYPALPPPIQSQADAADEEDTPSLRELVQAIDAHVEIVDLEVTGNLILPKMHKFSNHQPRTSQSDRPMTRPISYLPILQFDTYAFACFYFLSVHIFLSYLFSLPKVIGLW